MTTKITKAVTVVAFILEILFFAVFIAYVVLLILSIAKFDYVLPLVETITSSNNNELTVNGFSIIAVQDGIFIHSAPIAFALAGIFSFACYAMIFRNINLILRTSAGKTKFSKGETPFQEDICRMVREIGIFGALIPVTGLVLNIIFNAIIGFDVVSVEINGLVMGLIIIALSQIIRYGEKLENKNKQEN